MQFCIQPGIPCQNFCNLDILRYIATLIKSKCLRLHTWIGDGKRTSGDVHGGIGTLACAATLRCV